MSKKSRSTNTSTAWRVFFALVLPLIGSVVFSAIALAFVGQAGEDAQRATSFQLAGIGLASWFMGLIWYKLPGMGLRGHRALYAGIGFAVLGWLAFFVVRFATVEGEIVNMPNSGQTFFTYWSLKGFAPSCGPLAFSSGQCPIGEGH